MSSPQVHVGDLRLGDLRLGESIIDLRGFIRDGDSVSVIRFPGVVAAEIRRTEPEHALFGWAASLDPPKWEITLTVTRAPFTVARVDARDTTPIYDRLMRER